MKIKDFKRQGMISIYVLLLLFFLSVGITVASFHSINNNKINDDLIDRKKACYEVESALNICFYDYQDEIKELLRDYYVKIFYDRVSNKKLYKKYFQDNFNNKRLELAIDELQNSKKIKLKYNSIDDKFNISTSSKVKNSRALGIIDFNFLGNTLIPDDNESIVKIDRFDELFDNIHFNNYKLNEMESDIDIMNLDRKTVFLKLNGIHMEKNFSNLNSVSNNERSVSKPGVKNIHLNGIMLVEGDIKLSHNLYFDGLLILKDTQIISDDNAKLFVKGMCISNMDYNKKNLEIKNDMKVLQYTSDLDFFYDLEKINLRIK